MPSPWDGKTTVSEGGAIPSRPRSREVRGRFVDYLEVEPVRKEAEKLSFSPLLLRALWLIVVQLHLFLFFNEENRSTAVFGKG